jgi:hypothetical protein
MSDLADLRSTQSCDPDAIELASGEDALEFWDKIMRDIRQPIQRRMRAAEMRAQYRYPKLGVVATTSMSSDDFAACLDRAIARSGIGMKLIEHHRQDEGEGAKPSPTSPSALPAQAHWPTPRSAKSRRF